MNALQADIEQPGLAPSARADLRLAALLGIAGTLATALLFPYVLQVMPEALAKAQKIMPLPLLVLVQCAQALVLVGLLAFCGLRMGHRVGLGAPWLQACLARAPRKPQPWLLAIACGIVAAVAVVGLDPLFARHMPAPIHALPAQAAGAHAFAGFLASFYGGIVEEIELRLFFVTLLLWLYSLLRRGPVGATALGVAVVVAALAFGAGHLPAAANVWPLDAVVVARTVLLNCLAGLVFGWFYVRHGLESAMLSHFAADIVLHVLTPLAMG